MDDRFQRRRITVDTPALTYRIDQGWEDREVKPIARDTTASLHGKPCVFTKNDQSDAVNGRLRSMTSPPRTRPRVAVPTDQRADSTSSLTRPFPIRPLYVLSLLLVLSLWIRSIAADEIVVEGFEGPNSSWHLVEHDCGIAISLHDRVAEDDAQNSTYERIVFEAGQGTRVYFQHDITPSVVISELIPAVWMRSNQTRLSLHALVVLPNALDDQHAPIKFLVEGPTYTDVNRWQQLSFADSETGIEKLVRRKAQIYRRHFGRDLDESGAYVSALVVNAYGGPGVSRVEFDDLTLEGHVPWDRSLLRADLIAEDDGGRHEAIRLMNHAQDLPEESRIENSAGKLHVNGVPFAARVIQYQGESLYDLSKLGFNAVILDHPPTPVVAEEATASGMWLICPPHVEPLRNGDGLYRRVLAWNLGQDLLLGDLPRVRADAIRIANRPDLPRRPTYVHAHHGVSQFGTVIDIVEIGRPVLGTGFTATDYFEWLRRRCNSAPQRTTVWASIPTEYPVTLMIQSQAIAGRSIWPAAPPADVHGLALESLLAGCRGLVFQSRNRLDELDGDTRRRARMVQWVNETLVPLEPWLAAGTVVGSERTNSPRTVAADTLKTARADLVIVRRRDLPSERPRGRPEPITLHLNHSSLVTAAYQLTSLGAQPLRHDRVYQSLRIRLEDVHRYAYVVVTQDPLAIRHMQSQFGQSGATDHLMLQADCLADWRTSLERVIQELETYSYPVALAKQVSRQAGETLTQARRYLLTGDSRAADGLLQSCDLALQTAAQELLNRVQAPFSNPMASPLLLTTEGLPEHLRAARTLAQVKWSLNTLPAGGFDDLDHVLAAGWANHQGDDQRLQSHVDLLESIGNPQNRILRMRVDANEGLPPNALLETTPLWIVSPEIRVTPGDLLRIHGQIRYVDTTPDQTGELLVLDSIGGLALAERFDSDSEWREFTLYRFASDATPVRLTFALTGPGEAWIDNVEVQLAPLGQYRASTENDSSYRTRR